MKISKELQVLIIVLILFIITGVLNYQTGRIAEHNTVVDRARTIDQEVYNSTELEFIIFGKIQE